MGSLAGSEDVGRFSTLLTARPATPAREGEGWEAGGDSLLSHTWLARRAIYPTRGGGGGEEGGEASGSVNRPGCWGPAVLRQPSPQLGAGGGAGCTGGARVQLLRGEVCSPWCLAAN
jgi:hypothetical protein